MGSEPNEKNKYSILQMLAGIDNMMGLGVMDELKKVIHEIQESEGAQEIKDMVINNLLSSYKGVIEKYYDTGKADKDEQSFKNEDVKEHDERKECSGDNCHGCACKSNGESNKYCMHAGDIWANIKNYTKPLKSSKYTRPSKDDYYLNIAEQVAARSTCIRRKYGAVLVKNDRIISTGYNGSPRGDVNCCDVGYCEREHHNVPKGERYELCKAIHAEDNAITNAGRDQAIGSTLYIVGIEVESGKLANPVPCKMCTRKIKNNNIARVVGRFEDSNGNKHSEEIELKIGG